MHPDMIKAIKELKIKYDSMTKEEFRTHFKLDEHSDPSCYPDNCDGHCQGAGGCSICDQFWIDMNDKYMK